MNIEEEDEHFGEGFVMFWASPSLKVISGAAERFQVSG